MSDDPRVFQFPHTDTEKLPSGARVDIWLNAIINKFGEQICFLSDMDDVINMSVELFPEKLSVSQLTALFQQAYSKGNSAMRSDIFYMAWVYADFTSLYPSEETAILVEFLQTKVDAYYRVWSEFMKTTGVVPIVYANSPLGKAIKGLYISTIKTVDRDETPEIEEHLRDLARVIKLLE